MLLYPLLNDNGVYVVEDAHTCYWDEFDGGLGREGSFMEKAKKLLDSLNAWHIRDKDMVDEFTRSTFGVSFFDSMVVFEKKRHPKPYARLTGERQARPERLIDVVLPLGPTDSGKA